MLEGQAIYLSKIIYSSPWDETFVAKAVMNLDFYLA